MITKFEKDILKISRLIVCLSALLLWNCVEIPEYVILNVKASPSNGGTVSSSPSGPEYAVGTQVTLTAAPANGYAFTHWDGYVSETSKVVTVSISGDKYIKKTATANFVMVYTLAVDNKPVVGGKTTHDGTNILRADTLVTVTATPNPGYRFDGWSGASTSKDSTVKITMNTDKKLTANYVRIFTLEIDGITIDNGTATVTVNNGTPITYTEPITIDTGADVRVTVTAESGHRFIEWSGTPPSVNSSDESIRFKMTSNLSLFAIFGRVYTLTLINAADRGITEAIPLNKDFKYNDSTQVTVTAKSNEGYTFDRWSVSYGVLKPTSDARTVIVTMDTNKTLIAYYKPIYTLKIVVDSGTVEIERTVNGSVVSTATYNRDTAISIDSGDNVNAKATPLNPDKYEFKNWSVSGSSGLSISNPIDVRMDGNKTLTANYERVYTVTYNGNGHTSGTVPTDSKLYRAGASVTVLNAGTLTKTGSTFFGWSNGSGTNYSVGSTFVITGNTILYARWSQ